MRCIEIVFNYVSGNLMFMINRNMRCIEIQNPAMVLRGNVLINRNMRCIEITIGIDWFGKDAADKP